MHSQMVGFNNATKKSKMKRMRRSATIARLSVVTLLFQSQLILSSFTTATDENEKAMSDDSKYLDLDHLPQHRIRVSKRMIEYGNHPWHQYQDLNRIPIAPNAPIKKGTKSNDVEKQQGFENIHSAKSNEKEESANSSRRLLDHEIMEEFLPKSQIKMWSTMSNIHAPVEKPPLDNSDVDVDPADPNDSNASENAAHQNIRIRASLLSHKSTGSAYLNESSRKRLFKSMIHPALRSWSLALSVVPIQQKMIIDIDQLYDRSSCGPGITSGLPSVVVPIDHWEDGIEDTDLMVYLSVGFHGELLDDLEIAFQNENMRRGLQFQGSGDESSEPSVAPEVPSCSGSYLASSTYCSTDQYDRPVAGMLHLCIGKDFFENERLEINQITIMHELGHILGFNSQSLAHFRDGETGEPLTEREELHGDVKDVDVECTGVAEGRGVASIPLPSSEILQFKDVRGGLRVAQIVTPTVRQVARNHFDCQVLEGAELETYSYPNGKDQTPLDFADRCISDHWERRLFKSDIMNPIVDSVNSKSHISPLTLAYFMDSGWYQVNATRATEPDVWGRGAGCEFVNEQCISDGLVTQESSQFFCSSSQDHGCADDMMGKASCTVVSYDHDLANEFQYFTDPREGGQDIDLDFCPSFIGKKHDLCKTSKHSKIARLEEFGETSRCLSGKHGRNRNAAFCVPTACAIEQKALYVRVDEIWKECEYEGQVIQSWFDGGDYVVCPDPVRTCPSFFCPRNCLFDGFAGVCDDELKCVCPFGELGDDRCGNSSSFDLLEHTMHIPLYVRDSSDLKSDDKDIFDHTARMFIHMSAGEVIGFVASSLVALGVCFIVGTYFYRCIRQPGYRIPRLRDDSWRVDALRFSDSAEETNHQNNKDKMVASVLHNMRVESSVPCPPGDSDETVFTQDERTFYRSELPPLPGVGRVISVVGSTYVNDSIVPNDVDETRTLDGTANDSRTSGVNDLNSSRGTAPDVPRSQTRLRSRSRLMFNN